MIDYSCRQFRSTAHAPDSDAPGPLDRQDGDLLWAEFAGCEMRKGHNFEGGRGALRVSNLKRRGSFFVNSSRRSLLRLVTQQLVWLFSAKLGAG